MKTTKRDIELLLRNIAARRGRATPGPWGPIHDGTDLLKMGVDPEPIGAQHKYVHLYDKTRYVALAYTQPNADLIAHAWSDLGILLRVCRELLDEVR